MIRFTKLSQASLRSGLFVAAACCAALPARGDDTPSGTAMISSVQTRQGSLPRLVAAYGVAAPALDGGEAISLQQDGRVKSILVTQGERVQAGMDLMDFDLAPGSVSTYQQAVSALSLAKSERAHTAQLLRQSLATRDQMAQADKAVTDAQTVLTTLVQQGADTPQTKVKAPFNGIIETINVSTGDHVTAGSPLLSLTKLDGLVVTVGVDPGVANEIQIGQPVQLTRMSAISGSPVTAIAGKVRRVDGVVNAKTRLVDVDISVPAGSVISGESFRADINTGTVPGWIVPYDAVLNDTQGFYLFQVNGGKAARVDVQLLAQRASQDAVSGKINPALPVIVDGASQVTDGSPVRSAQ